MLLAFKFRLYPNQSQESQMTNAVEACRRLWNMALADRKLAWEAERLSTTYEQQCRMLTVETKADSHLGALYSQVGQDVLKRLDRGFEAFFRHLSKYPRFKKYRSSGSFTYPQAYNGSVKLDVQRKRIFLSKIGNIRIIAHRPVPSGKLIKTCTFRREPDGKWYACLMYDDDVVPQQGLAVLESWKAPVGIDLGLNSLITTSDGEKRDHPKFLRKAEKRLKHLQRDLSNKRKGSKNWEKARHKLAAQHSTVSNQRRDNNHKLSAQLVKTHDLVVFEDLNVDAMLRNHHLAKSIQDAGWSQLVIFAEYKAKRKRSFVTKVPSPYTTQECYFCGTLNHVPLGVREFDCRGCGKALDRDKNAARIVLGRGIAKVGQDKVPSGPRPGGETPLHVVPELKPVEIGPPLSGSNPAASPVIEAGTISSGVMLSNLNHPLLEAPFSNGGGCHLSLYPCDFIHSSLNILLR